MMHNSPGPDMASWSVVDVVSVAVALGVVACVCIAVGTRSNTSFLPMLSGKQLEDNVSLMERKTGLTCIAIVKVTSELHLSRLL